MTYKGRVEWMKELTRVNKLYSPKTNSTHSIIRVCMCKRTALALDGDQPNTPFTRPLNWLVYSGSWAAVIIDFVWYCHSVSNGPYLFNHFMSLWAHLNTIVQSENFNNRVQSEEYNISELLLLRSLRSLLIKALFLHLAFIAF